MGIEFRDDKGNKISNPGITNIPEAKTDINFLLATEVSKLKVENMMLRQQLNDIKKILEDK